MSESCSYTILISYEATVPPERVIRGVLSGPIEPLGKIYVFLSFFSSLNHPLFSFVTFSRVARNQSRKVKLVPPTPEDFRTHYAVVEFVDVVNQTDIDRAAMVRVPKVSLTAGKYPGKGFNSTTLGALPDNSSSNVVERRNALELTYYKDLGRLGSPYDFSDLDHLSGGYLVFGNMMIGVWGVESSRWMGVGHSRPPFTPRTLPCYLVLSSVPLLLSSVLEFLGITGCFVSWEQVVCVSRDFAPSFLCVAPDD